jgi:hypothetical protein
MVTPCLALQTWPGVLLARAGGNIGWAPGCFPLAMFAVFAAIISVVACFSYLAEKKRREALQRVADELGFTFSQKDPGLLLRFAGMHLFSQGHGQRITNVLQGEANGLRVDLFDYTFTIGGGKSSSTHRQTVVSFVLPDRDLPAFSLRPENTFHRIGAWFGYQDINFEDFPVFSKRYLLRGPDEPAIRKLFTPEVMTFYEGLTGVCTEGAGCVLIFYRERHRVAPEQTRGFLEEGFGVLKVFRSADAAPRER